jgi:arginyl-tRNA synthetase
VTPAGLAAALRASIVDAVAAGEFSAEVPVRTPVTASRPGMWSSPIALRLAATSPAATVQVVAAQAATAQAVPLPPLALAQALAARLAAVPGIASVAVAPPGFLNITLDDRPGELARTIVEAGRRTGSGRPERPERWIRRGWSGCGSRMPGSAR